jgi:hypothetical protein
MRAKLLGSAAVGVIVGSIMFNGPSARGGIIGDIVSDPQSYLTMATMQGAITSVISKMQDSLVNKFTDIGNLLDDKLTNGFTQLTNYSKATVGAQQQIANANNTVMATFQKDVRNAELRDEHTLSPQACAALNLGQAITVGAGQAWKVRQALGTVTDPRGEAGPGTPAYAGQGQAAGDCRKIGGRNVIGLDPVESEAGGGLCPTRNSPRLRHTPRRPAPDNVTTPNFAAVPRVEHGLARVQSSQLPPDLLERDLP